MRQRKAGFTYIEVVVVMGIVAILYSIISVSLLGATRRSTLGADLDVLITDFKQQQTNAIAGEGQGSSHGIYLGTDSYTLFKGSSYNPVDPANTIINLTPTNQISPTQEIVFTAGNGDTNANSFSIVNVAGGEQKTVEFNRHGVITTIY